jgi:hypothetical protein
MTRLHSLHLATFLFVLFGITAPLSAQPLYHTVNSLEYLLGNSSAVFVGTPRSFARHVEKGVKSVRMTFAVEETLKGIHQPERTVSLYLGHSPVRSAQRTKEFAGFHKRKCRCLVLVLFQKKEVTLGQDQVYDLSGDSKLNVATKNLNFIHKAKRLVKTSRKYCKANPGALVTKGIRFYLPRVFAQKHYSKPEVMVMLPIDPALEKVAKTFLNSDDPNAKWSAQRALRYFGRNTNDESSNIR